MVATGHFVNLPITYKSQKSNFKISKKSCALIRLNVQNFLYFTKKIILTPKKNT